MKYIYYLHQIIFLRQSNFVKEKYTYLLCSVYLTFLYICIKLILSFSRKVQLSTKIKRVDWGCGFKSLEVVVHVHTNRLHLWCKTNTLNCVFANSDQVIIIYYIRFSYLLQSTCCCLTTIIITIFVGSRWFSFISIY